MVLLAFVLSYLVLPRPFRLFFVPSRYQAHDSSQQIAEKQQDATERRMVELQESSAGSAWIDVQFLKTAMEQLIECRRVLK